MVKVDLKEAQGSLPHLIEEAASGEEVVIALEDGSSCRILYLPPPGPKPRFGSARGKIRIADDFDEPLEDFEDYAP